jgi:protein ImuA
MGTAQASPRLEYLRRSLAKIDPSFGPQFCEPQRGLSLDGGAIDTALGGGLACGALHELAPVAPIDLAAATGFALTLAILSGGARGQTLWIATDFATCEAGGPYGPGLDLFGLASDRLLTLRVRHPADALWAMEEALRCHALTAVIAELSEAGAEADLTATRRLVLAARASAGVGLLLRQRAIATPSAAATRWRIAAAPSEPDRFGGLGRSRFELSLIKNRRGPSGRWIIEWNHHERTFRTPLSFAVAAPASDRPDRAPQVYAGRAHAG